MQVFDRVGVFDERFFVYWEDADFCLRCRAHGVTVTILAAPTIAHKVSALTGGSSPFSTQMYHRNQILLLHKHFGAARTWLEAPAIVAKILARRVLRRDEAETTRLRLRTVWTSLPSLRKVEGI
jgi:GT2 family glycosyltransferase